MGDNLPEVGELVAYYASEEDAPTMAKIVAVVFWDLVDLELAHGVRLIGVRRVVELHGGEVIARAGRFARLVP